MDRVKPNFIEFSGGEPLTRNDMLQIMKNLSDNNHSIMLRTNATLVNKQIAKKLKKLDNLIMVAVSLDGSNENVFSILRGNGVFEKTISGIKNLVDNGAAGN